MAMAIEDGDLENRDAAQFAPGPAIRQPQRPPPLGDRAALAGGTAPRASDANHTPWQPLPSLRRMGTLLHS
jgi:hypothetical protein